jgi:hypothetical protein
LAHPRDRATAISPSNLRRLRQTNTTESKAGRIRQLNDAFRRTFVGGAVIITQGVEAMPLDQRRSLLEKVRSFDALSEDNDPRLRLYRRSRRQLLLQVDYCDRKTEFGSPDPADPAVTTRVMTIMLAEEY